MISRRMGALLTVLALALPALFLSLPALAQAVGQPEPWQLGMSPGYSPLKHRLHDFHDLMMWVITGIVIFVFVLLAIIIVRFNARANPTPSKTTHNTTIEVVWTVVPALILLAIAVPSFRLLYFLDRAPDAEMTVKVTGHQWYWSYEYPDQAIAYDSLIVQDSDLKPGQPRQLAVDNNLVLPVGTKVRILVGSQDVMHSWLVPTLGLQVYATPGRTNEIWVEVDTPGIFYGQCNQICGVNHGFMPIAVQGIPKDEFPAWLEEAKKKFAKSDDGAGAGRLASAAQ